MKMHARKRLLQERKLDVKKCIAICRTSESATTQLQAIGAKLGEVHTVNNEDSAMKIRGKRGGGADDRNNQMPRKPNCKLCCKSHVLKKELCPAWDKRCNLCGKMNHWKGSEMCEKKDKVHLVRHDSELSDSDSDVAFVKTVVSVLRKTSQLIVRCVLILRPSNCRWTVVPLYA